MPSLIPAGQHCGFFFASKGPKLFKGSLNAQILNTVLIPDIGIVQIGSMVAIVVVKCCNYYVAEKNATRTIYMVTP